MKKGELPNLPPSSNGSETGAVDAESLQDESNDVSKASNENGVVGDGVSAMEVEGNEGKEAKKVEEVGGSVSIFKLFAFADPLDYFLIFLGTLGAAVHGCALPVFFLFFGKLLNGFGSYANQPEKMANIVGTVSIDTQIQLLTQIFLPLFFQKLHYFSLATVKLVIFIADMMICEFWRSL